MHATFTPGTAGTADAEEVRLSLFFEEPRSSEDHYTDWHFNSTYNEYRREYKGMKVTKQVTYEGLLYSLEIGDQASYSSESINNVEKVADMLEERRELEVAV